MICLLSAGLCTQVRAPPSGKGDPAAGVGCGGTLQFQLSLPRMHRLGCLQLRRHQVRRTPVPPIHSHVISTQQAWERPAAAGMPAQGGPRDVRILLLLLLLLHHQSGDWSATSCSLPSVSPGRHALPSPAVCFTPAACSTQSRAALMSSDGPNGTGCILCRRQSQRAAAWCKVCGHCCSRAGRPPADTVPGCAAQGGPVWRRCSRAGGPPADVAACPVCPAGGA